jgi:outer membrane protein with beta-barrel domain
MSVRKWLITACIFAVASAAAPRTASADWTLTPFLGWNFGGSADVTGSGGSTLSNKFEKKLDYGASLTGMGAGPIGFEIDLGYSPNFFESSTTATGFRFTNKSNVTTLTGNLVVGAHTGSVRPYVVGGVGLIRTNVQDFAELFATKSKNDFGMDIGGGVMGFFSKSVGLRGDVRYFRGFRGSSDSSNPTGLALSDFKFWRGSLGLSLKF